MGTKAKAPTRASSAKSPRPSRASASEAAKEKKQSAPAGVEGSVPGTTGWHLEHIAALGQRVQEYVKLMSKVRGMTSSSAEAKQKAIVAFHERLAVLEQQLGRIHEELQLG